jgi:hypothetical protein
LQDGCNSFNFGRRKTNNFAFDDEHLSGLHARIFLLHGQFVIEDLHSTNGYFFLHSAHGFDSVSLSNLQAASCSKMAALSKLAQPLHIPASAEAHKKEQEWRKNTMTLVFPVGNRNAMCCCCHVDTICCV